MFWRYVNPIGSNFEALLTRDPPPTLEDLLDDTDLLTECKTQNAKLMEVLGRPDIVRGLFQWVTKGLEPRTGTDDTDMERTRRQRFRQLSAEVLCSDAWAITETTLSNPDEFLRPFWDSILGAPPTADSISLSGQLASAASPRPSDDGPSDPTGRRTSSQTSTTEVDLNDHHDETETPASDAESISGEDVKLDESEPVKPEDSSDEWLPAGAKGEDESEDELDHAKEATKDGSKEDDGLGELDQVDNEREVVYGQWSRVNSHLLGKKTAEMLAFIRLQPAIVERLLANITSPAVVDLLIRIIQCEDNPDGQGVLSWLSSEGLIPRLTDLLSPAHPPSTHDAAAELLKGIIIMSAPAPAPFANPGQQNGMDQNGGGAVGGSRNNRFARELVSDEHIAKLVGFMLEEEHASAGDATPRPKSPVLSLAESAVGKTSSLVSVISILIELIRKNNSDYSEPHLFHTLRNGLMSHSSAQASKALLEGEDNMEDEAKEESNRVELEEKMKDLNSTLGIVHLGSLLTVLSEKLVELQKLLASPRTKAEPMFTSTGPKSPLTLERFRIIELYAELLHCSNMAVLNRSVGKGPKYDAEGQLMGGLAGLDVLNGALNGTDGDEDEDEDENEEDEALSPGDILKQKFMDNDLISTLLDLFVEYPLNNFLHNVVYDVIQQILSGRLEQGLNQALIVHLFKKCDLINRILDGQRRQNELPVRQGYMGHLVLIAEDTLKFLAECPDDLRSFLTPTYDGEAWQAFVDGPYAASKEKDNSTMGGGKPSLSLLGGNGNSALDDAESDSDEDITEQMDTSTGSSSTQANNAGTTSEMFSRYMAQQISASSSDRQFESSSDDDEDEDSEWMADRHSFQPSSSVPPTTSSRVDPFGASSAFDDDDDAWGTFQSTPSGGAMTSSDDPFGDDFATGPSSGGANSEALAALEWNDATFQAEFRDFDSEDDDGAVLPSPTSGQIHIPDTSGDSDEEMSFTPTASSSQWSLFNTADDNNSPSSTTSPQSIPPSSLSRVHSTHPVSPSTAAPLSHLSLSSSPVSTFHLPTAAANIFTPMSAISPPEPSLLEAVSEKSPLGPGVSADTKSITQISLAGVPESMLEKTAEDGTKIVVPKDEIVLAVEAEAEAEALQAAATP